MAANYSLPFRPGTIMDGDGHPQERNVEMAIQEHITALLRTSLGESSGNPLFGCRIWDHIAEPVRGESWLAQFKEDVRDAIVKNERRLEDVHVELILAKGDRDRNELTLTITGRTTPGDRPFHLSRVILTDPIRIN